MAEDRVNRLKRLQKEFGHLGTQGRKKPRVPPPLAEQPAPAEVTMEEKVKRLFEEKGAAGLVTLCGSDTPRAEIEAALRLLFESSPQHVVTVYRRSPSAVAREAAEDIVTRMTNQTLDALASEGRYDQVAYHAERRYDKDTPSSAAHAITLLADAKRMDLIKAVAETCAPPPGPEENLPVYQAAINALADALEVEILSDLHLSEADKTGSRFADHVGHALDTAFERVIASSPIARKRDVLIYICNNNPDYFDRDVVRGSEDSYVRISRAAISRELGQLIHFIETVATEDERHFAISFLHGIYNEILIESPDAGQRASFGSMQHPYQAAHHANRALSLLEEAHDFERLGDCIDALDSRIASGNTAKLLSSEDLAEVLEFASEAHARLVVSRHTYLFMHVQMHRSDPAMLKRIILDRRNRPQSIANMAVNTLVATNGLAPDRESLISNLESIKEDPRYASLEDGVKDLIDRKIAYLRSPPRRDTLEVPAEAIEEVRVAAEEAKTPPALPRSAPRAESLEFAHGDDVFEIAPEGDASASATPLGNGALVRVRPATRPPTPSTREDPISSLISEVLDPATNPDRRKNIITQFGEARNLGALRTIVERTTDDETIRAATRALGANVPAYQRPNITPQARLTLLMTQLRGEKESFGSIVDAIADVIYEHPAESQDIVLELFTDPDYAHARSQLAERLGNRERLKEAFENKNMAYLRLVVITHTIERPSRDEAFEELLKLPQTVSSENHVAACELVASIIPLTKHLGDEAGAHPEYANEYARRIVEMLADTAASHMDKTALVRPLLVALKGTQNSGYRKTLLDSFDTLAHGVRYHGMDFDSMRSEIESFARGLSAVEGALQDELYDRLAQLYKLEVSQLIEDALPRRKRERVSDVTYGWSGYLYQYAARQSIADPRDDTAPSSLDELKPPQKLKAYKIILDETEHVLLKPIGIEIIQRAPPLFSPLAVGRIPPKGPAIRLFRKLPLNHQDSIRTHLTSHAAEIAREQAGPETKEAFNESLALLAIIGNTTTADSLHESVDGLSEKHPFRRAALKTIHSIEYRLGKADAYARGNTFVKTSPTRGSLAFSGVASVASAFVSGVATGSPLAGVAVFITGAALTGATALVDRRLHYGEFVKTYIDRRTEQRLRDQT